MSISIVASDTSVAVGETYVITATITGVTNTVPAGGRLSINIGRDDTRMRVMSVSLNAAATVHLYANQSNQFADGLNILAFDTAPTSAVWVIAWTVKDISFQALGFQSIVTGATYLPGSSGTFNVLPDSNTVTISYAASPATDATLSASVNSLSFGQTTTIVATFQNLSGAFVAGSKPFNVGLSAANFDVIGVQMNSLAQAAYGSVPANVLQFQFNSLPASPWIITWTLRASNNITQQINAYGFCKIQTFNAPFINTNTIGITLTAVTAPHTSVPATPTGFVATEPTPRNVEITWTDNAVPGLAGEDGVEIWRSTDNLSFTLLSQLGVGTETYTDTNVNPSTLYYYNIYSVNYIGKSTALNGNITTAAQVVAPTAPSGLTGSSSDGYNVSLSWTDNSSTELGFNVKRSPTTGGPYVTLGSVGPDITIYTDSTAQPQATYYYIVTAFVWGAESTPSNEATVTTPPVQLTLSSVCPFSLDPDSRNSMFQVAQRLFVTSDLDRWVIFVNNAWFLAGLKPQLAAPTIGASLIAGGLTGTFTFYICLWRSSDSTRSVPGPVSASQVLATQTCTITPQLNTALDKVEIRDIGYDANGVQIDGCDFWELYVTEQNLGAAYRVAVLPVATTSYLIPTDWTIDKLTNGQQREMELDFQSLIPPACAFITYYNNRIYTFGETTIKPNNDDLAAGAKLNITQGATQFTLDNYTVSDAIQYKQLYLNKKATGWFVTDVIDDQTVQIRNPDANIQAQGFRGTTGPYYDFAFGANPSRVYASAYFTGEPSGGITFSPETFPPTTIFETEFDPDDNTDPSGAITSKDTMYIAKPQKWFFVTGGTEPGFPLISVEAISRGSGLLASNTICRDRNDTVYYLSEEGLHRVTQNGVEKVTDFTGNAHLFQDVFDVSSIYGSVATWFSREDYLVCANINRIGNTGNTDGFLFDSRNNAILPFNTIPQITSMLEARKDNGDLQLLFGDAAGFVSGFLVKNLYTDGRNFTLAVPSSTESAVACYITSGIVESDSGFTIRGFKPRVKQVPLSTPVSCLIEIDGKFRNADPVTFQTYVSRGFTVNQSPNIVSLGGNRMQSFQQRFSFSSLPTANTSRIEFNGMATLINERGASGANG